MTDNKGRIGRPGVITEYFRHCTRSTSPELSCRSQYLAPPICCKTKVDADGIFVFHLPYRWRIARTFHTPTDIIAASTRSKSGGRSGRMGELFVQNFKLVARRCCTAIQSLLAFQTWKTEDSSDHIDSIITRCAGTECIARSYHWVQSQFCFILPIYHTDGIFSI